MNRKCSSCVQFPVFSTEKYCATSLISKTEHVHTNFPRERYYLTENDLRVRQNLKESCSQRTCYLIKVSGHLPSWKANWPITVSQDNNERKHIWKVFYISVLAGIKQQFNSVVLIITEILNGMETQDIKHTLHDWIKLYEVHSNCITIATACRYLFSFHYWGPLKDIPLAYTDTIQYNKNFHQYGSPSTYVLLG